MAKHLYEIEVTDTFGGEANYSWVNRHKLVVAEGASQLAIVRAAKRKAGWSGLRCRTSESNSGIELRPYGILQVMFVSWHDCGEPETPCSHFPNEGIRVKRINA